MDTTTLAPPASVWDLLADLAACGNESALLSSPESLTRAIVQRVCAHLQCPWAVFLLHTVAPPLVIAHGLDDAAVKQLVAGHKLPDKQPAIELTLTLDGTAAGVIWLAMPAHLETLLVPGCVDAIRRQIELLISLQQREWLRLSSQLDAAREQFILHENGSVITSGLSLEAMLARISENITLALRADRCLIQLRDQQDNALFVDVASYSQDDNEALPNATYSLDELNIIAQSVLTGDQPLVAINSDYHSGTFGFQSALILALRARDQVVGLLSVGYPSRDHEFTRAEMSLAQTLADQVATAVLNARLHAAEQQRAAELAALGEINQQLRNEQTLPDLVETLIGGIQRLFPETAIRVVLYNTESHQIRLAQQTGFHNPKTDNNAIMQGLADWVSRYRRTLRLANFARPPVKIVPQTLANGIEAQSYVGTPILLGGHLIGTLELFGSRPDQFTTAHERILELVAGQTAQAVIDVGQFVPADSHLRGRVQQLAALQRISRQLTATLSLDIIFTFALAEALQATAATQAFIALRSGGEDGLRVTDADNGELIAYVALGEHNDGADFSILAAAGYNADEQKLVGQLLHHSNTVAGESIANGEPRLIDDLDHDDRLNRAGEAVASTLALPVFYEDQIVGVVNLHSSQPHAFDHDTFEFVRALTDQVALALGNAQRYEEQQRQRTLLQQRAGMLRQVLDIGQALRADRSIEDVLEQIAFSIIDTAGFRRAVFNLVDADDPSVLRVVTGAGLALTELQRMSGAPWPKGYVDALFDKRFRLGRCFFIPAEAAPELNANFDITAITSELDIEANAPNEWHADDALFVPLYSTDARLLGVLSVDEPYNRLRPTARSLEALEVLADQAAIAIENARLLHEARAQAEQMRALFQVGTATVSTLSLDELLERVYTEIVAYLGVPSYFFVASYDVARETIRFELMKHADEVLGSHYKRVEPKAGLSAHVIDSGAPLVIDDYQEERDALPQAVVLSEGIRSWVGIPLRSQNQVIGVLSVQSFEPHAFSPRDVRFLASLANQLAIALENARLFEERERRIAELDVINDVGRITSTTLDLPTMFTQSFARVRSFLTVDAGFIFSYNEELHEIDLALHADGDFLDIQNLAVAPSPQSLTQKLITTRQPLVFQDLALARSKQKIRTSTFGTERRSASWLGVPLLGNDGEIVGVMSIQSYEPSLYGEREVAFMTALASQLALGIQNVRLFLRTQDQLRQLGLLNRASSVAATTLSISEIYQSAAEAMATAAGADQARVMLYDVAAGTNEVVAELHPTVDDQQNLTPALSPVWIEWLKEHRRPLIAYDAQHDPLCADQHSVLQDANIGSLALIPLLAGDNVIGAVGLEFVGRQQHLAPQTMELCQTIANQMVTAVEKAWLFEATEQSAAALGSKVGELSTLLEAARVLSSSLRPDEVLDDLMEVVGRHLNVSTVSLWTIDSDAILHSVAMLGISKPVAQQMSVPVGQGMTGRVAATGEPLVIADVEQDGTSLYPSFNRENKLTSFLGVPVVSRQKVVGVLSVMTVERREFSLDEQALLIGMADQAAIALENARLSVERDRRIKELVSFNRISQRLNATLDLNDLLTTLHGEIGKVLDMRDSFIALYDEQNKQISYPIFWENGLPTRNGMVLTIGSDPSITERVIKERRPMLLTTREEVVGYLQEVGDPYALDSSVASWLSVPIIEGDAVFGVVNVQDSAPKKFDAEDERFLVTVAGLAATSIARAKLFTERERRLREVSVLQDIGSAITSTLNLQDVLERLHAQLGRVVDVSTSYIGLYDAASDILQYAIAVDHGERVTFSALQVGRGGLNHWVIRNRRPLMLGTEEEAGAYRSPELHAAVQEERVGPENKVEESFMVVPITSGDDVLGVINIQSYQRHAFSQEDLHFVTAVANQAAAAISNARLYQERGRRIEELATFNDIGRQFSSVPKLDDLMSLIYRQTSRLFDTTNFYIGLYDEFSNQISFPMYYHEGALTPTSPISQPDSLSHHVIRMRQPLLLQGEEQERQLSELQITPVGPHSRSWLGVPMIANDKVIGIIGIQDYERDNAYTPEDVRLLSTLASWGAVALANARLFTEQRQSLQELGVMYDMSVQLAGTLDAGEAQRIVVINALELLNVQICALVLFDNRRQVAHQFVYDQQHPERTAYPFAEASENALKLLLQGDRALLVSDAAQIDAAKLVEDLNIHGLIGDIIGSRDEPLGVLWLGDRQPRDWQSREVSLLSIITMLAGQVLKSAALFEREQARRAAADTLRDVAEQLTGVLEQDEVFALLLDQLARVVPYDSASLMLRNMEADMLQIVATRGFNEQQRLEIEAVAFNLSDDIDLRTIVRSKRPLVLYDAQMSQDFVEVEGTSHIHGWIGAPLLLGDEVIGLLTVDSKQLGAYNEEDAQIAFTMASQSAQAIRNARLFEEVRHFNTELEQRVEERTAALAELNTQLADEKQRLQAVHAITVELTASLELNETLAKTLQLAARNLGVDRGSIMLWDDKSRQLICRAVLGEGGQVYAEQIPISFARGGGLAGWVRENQQPICIGDVRRDRRWIQENGRASTVRSVVAVPLRAENVGTLGVLMLTSPLLNYFTTAQEQLLSTIANEVAIVIHNAELYSLVQEYATRLSESFNQQREETLKNQAILRSLGEGVLVLDEREKVILFNPAAEQIVGIVEHQILGQKLAAMLPAKPSSESARVKLLYDTLQQGLHNLSESSMGYQHHLELPHPSQSIELYFSPVLDLSGTLYGSVVVLRDVTREIEADRAKRDFISSVSHELRTPLTAIKGYVDLLTLGAAGPISETQGQFLGVVKNNANRLMDLINDILEIGRIDSNKIQLNFEPVDVPAVFQDVLQTMRAEIQRKNMHVDVDMPEDLPLIEADGKRLTQVVLNLISNAIKYTFSNGKIELRAFLNPAGMLEVDVVDNGVGISAEQQQNLFRRFYRADNPLRDEAGGTGLGLSIARSFIELHGGEMWVKSEIGEGSTFSFVVPLTQPETVEETE